MDQTTQTVEVRLPHHRYRVLIGSGILGDLGAVVRDAIGAVAPTAGVFSDDRVQDPYGQAAAQSMESAGFTVLSKPVAGGEANKNLQTVAALYGELARARLERSSPVAAVGGGVIGDTVGFLAATYLRGVPFVQCPTTLLAMVDASVGGKVGVNLPEGKNLVGSFHQPVAVVADVKTLLTLDDRNFRCGLAECVKHAVIRDEVLFRWIEEHAERLLSRDPGLIIELVRRNVSIKARVVEADEKEAGQRAHLNFGHTFAHAIESSAGYDDRWLHGEAVAVGMVAAARLGEALGCCDRGLSDRVSALIVKLGLPVRGDLGPTDRLIDLMRVDKKVASGDVRFILPNRIGDVRVVTGVDFRAVVEAWQAVGAGD